MSFLVGELWKKGEDEKGAAGRKKKGISNVRGLAERWGLTEEQGKEYKPGQGSKLGQLFNEGKRLSSSTKLPSFSTRWRPSAVLSNARVCPEKRYSFFCNRKSVNERRSTSFDNKSRA